MSVLDFKAAAKKRFDNRVTTVWEMLESGPAKNWNHNLKALSHWAKLSKEELVAVFTKKIEKDIQEEIEKKKLEM